MKKYKMTKARIVLRGILDDLGLYEVTDIIIEYPEILKEVERLASDFISRTLDEVSVKNIIADEIGYHEYQRRLKELEVLND